MCTIAFDESGYSGSNLLNEDQPVFTFASVNMEEVQARELLNLVTTQAREYKFTNVRKRPKELEVLFNHDFICEETVQICIAHKDYLIICHIINELIEYVYYKHGEDLYKNRQNYCMANMLYFTMPHFSDPILWIKLKKSFVEMFRNRDEVSINLFYDVVYELCKSSKKEFIEDIFYMVLSTRGEIQEILDNRNDFVFDSTMAMLVGLCDYWGKKLGERFNVVIDKSKPLLESIFDIKKISNPKLSPLMVGSLELPLKIDDISFVDSKNSVLVQLADVLAGALAYYGKALINNNHDELYQIISESKIVNLLQFPIWPAEVVTPQNTISTKEDIDKMIDILKS